MNPFAEKYKTLSNAQLVEIIDTPDNYQAAAVTAAEDELLARNISLEDMAEARAGNKVRTDETAAKAEKKKAFENKFVNAASLVIETISPVQKTPASVNRVILLLSIVFGIFGLVQIYHFADYEIRDLRLNYHMPISMTLPSLVQGLYLVGTAFMFWKRMKWGWVFLGIYITYSAAGTITAVLVVLFRNTFVDGLHYDFYPYNAASFLFSGLFYGCCIWYIYRANMRALYTIDKPLSIITAATGAFLALLTIVLVAA